jgi:predicted Zn-dependent protease
MKKLFSIFAAILLFSGCVTNPLTGQRTMAFISNSQLFPSSFAQYDQFLKENTVVTGTAEAAMVARVGNRIAQAAQKWLSAEGNAHYLDEYRWEFNLIRDDAINAWVMPGGKIVFYTGILPVTQTEAGIAVVMGHEIAHALLNHGQQRMSAGLLQELVGVSLNVGMGLAGLSPETQALAMTAYGVGSTLGGTLPFSRANEIEADRYGTILMAIAGYNPEEAVVLWERMAALGSGGNVPQFLSTHPSDSNRIRELQKRVPEAKQKAAEFGVYF